jgi:hypothetical protein
VNKAKRPQRKYIIDMIVEMQFGIKGDTYILNTAGACNGSTTKPIVISKKFVFLV